MPGAFARFYCENCGAEVNRGAGRCPSCGRLFSSIRCPGCGFTGDEALFKKGCPVCGYCTKNESGKPETDPPVSNSLPAWVYAVAGLGLAAAAAVLFMKLR
jgi:predicted RNA-binding Zn-ribbon protein involved in translation (DUF1610 family)